jgi:hypothetical protein
MPYITGQHDRAMLNPVTKCAPATHAGELNYQITMLCIAFMEREGKTYDAINTVVGALECAKLEFYRRAAAPYEDGKIKQNGDVYP